MLSTPQIQGDAQIKENYNAIQLISFITILMKSAVSLDRFIDE